MMHVRGRHVVKREINMKYKESSIIVKLNEEDWTNIDIDIAKILQIFDSESEKWIIYKDGKWVYE